VKTGTAQTELPLEEEELAQELRPGHWVTCPYCGKPIISTSLRCRWCGRRLGNKWSLQTQRATKRGKNVQRKSAGVEAVHGHMQGRPALPRLGDVE